jgi:hypothetical protein
LPSDSSTSTPVSSCRETRHFTLTMDRHLQLADPTGEDALEVPLPQREPVVVAGGEVAYVQRDPGEPLDLHRLALGEEPVRDAALIEHLDGARVQTAGARALDLRAGAPLDDRNVDSRQRQFRRQHQPGWASAGDQHSTVGQRSIASAGFQLGIVRLSRSRG